MNPELILELYDGLIISPLGVKIISGISKEDEDYFPDSVLVIKELNGEDIGYLKDKKIKALYCPCLDEEEKKILQEGGTDIL